MKHLIIILLAILCLACSRPSPIVQPQAPAPDIDATIQVAVRATLTALAPAATRTAPQPTASPMPTATAGPTATPASIEILSHRSYSQMGLLMIVGEVQNNTTVDVSYVLIYATLYDKEGQVIGTGMGVAAMESIPPGGKSPFQVMSSEWTGLDHYSLHVQTP